MSSELPGFSADRSLGRAREGYQLITNVASVRPGFGPAQDRPCAIDRTSRACEECWQDCIAPCAPRVRDCFPGCRRECGGQPGDNPPLPCTPQDNSFNRALCTTAIDAWLVAATAVCGATLGGVPGVGPALAGACIAGAKTLTTQ
jgi:hypothetical protein